MFGLAKGRSQIRSLTVPVMSSVTGRGKTCPNGLAGLQGGCQVTSGRTKGVVVRPRRVRPPLSTLAE